MDYDPDVQMGEDHCPNCGHSTLWRECYAIGCDEGRIDGYEYDDPLWFSPGETYSCSTCGGIGVFYWCPNCGYDMISKRIEEENAA